MFSTCRILLPCYKGISLISGKPENAGEGEHAKPCNINKTLVVEVVLKREVHWYFGIRSKQFVYFENAKAIQLATWIPMRLSSYPPCSQLWLWELEGRSAAFLFKSKRVTSYPMGCCTGMHSAYSAAFLSISSLWILSTKGILN